jgi:tripartite-type tricarboxylate transporter receptor subunit TctC
MLGFRVIAFAFRSRVLYVCTKCKVQSTNIWAARRRLGVTTAQRSKALPDVPTVAEAGIAGYDASVWWGFLGPAGMAPDLVAKIHADLPRP